MRGNGWQITAIISIILVILLLIPLVLMGRGWQTLAEKAATAEKNQVDTAQKAATLEQQVGSLKSLIGNADTGSLEELVKQHSDVLGAIQPGGSNPNLTYHDTINTLIGDVKAMREELHKISSDKAQLESDYNHVHTNFQNLLDQEKANVKRIETARNAEQNQYVRSQEEYEQKLNEANAQQNATLARLERERHQLTDERNQLDFANRDMRETNTYLANLLEDVRNPSVEHPAGKIISINQQAGTAVINLGSADGLLVRTMFSVYHASMSGLTFHSSASKNAVYCEICKREIGRDISKGSVEVMRIIDPHKSEVRILDDVLTDPMMVGDVIYSPIWKPGQKMRFALTAGIRLPGSSKDSGIESIVHLIESNGGQVDCWIDTAAPEGEDYLKGSLSDLTNYIVVSEEAARELDPEVALIQESLMESARNRAVKVIGLGDLLSRMGWRNMTPIYVFGSEEFLPEEMRAISVPQYSTRSTDNPVSPMFTPDNPNVRVDAREANPGRPSRNVVSPIFNNNAPPPPSSSGKTSDLFRPRTPQGGKN